MCLHAIFIFVTSTIVSDMIYTDMSCFTLGRLGLFAYRSGTCISMSIAARPSGRKVRPPHMPDIGIPRSAEKRRRDIPTCHVSRLVGLFAYRYMYLDVDRGSAFWARLASFWARLASSCAQYTSRTLPIDHSPRAATDENDTGIAVPERTVLPFRTPCSVIFTSLISALRIAARSFGKVRPPPLLPPPLPQSLPPSLPP